MKRIWDETMTIAAQHPVRWTDYFHDELVVCSHTCHISVRVIAWYDRTPGVLVINRDVDMSLEQAQTDWYPDHPRLYFTVTSREQAYRKVVEVADKWAAEVRDALPPLRDADELLAEARASAPTPF